MSFTTTGSTEVDVLVESSKDSFERLISPHLRRLYRLAFRLTENHADAQDLLQEVLLKLFRRADELSSIADLRPWTGRVLYNCFIDWRRRTKKTRQMQVVTSPAGISQETDEVNQVPSPELGPEDMTALALDIKLLDSALARLSEEHRLLVLLHDAEGCSLEEISTMTAIPLGTVKSRLHRARERLRQFCGDGTLFS
jgi:RNA polymerase sigma-70 factor, ECF subfamily